MEPDVIGALPDKRKELVQKLLQQYEQLMQTKNGQAALMRAGQKSNPMFGGRRSKNSVDLPAGVRPQLTFPSYQAPGLQGQLGVQNQAHILGGQASPAYGVPAGDISSPARSQVATAMAQGSFDPGAPRHLAMTRPEFAIPGAPPPGPSSGPAPLPTAPRSPTGSLQPHQSAGMLPGNPAKAVASPRRLVANTPKPKFNPYAGQYANLFAYGGVG